MTPSHEDAGKCVRTIRSASNEDINFAECSSPPKYASTKSCTSLLFRNSTRSLRDANILPTPNILSISGVNAILSSINRSVGMSASYSVFNIS